jgi:flavodoxin/Fe-S-cluster-containing hydrogenase component 2
MKTVVIYYFSGTGNTELVANMIEDEFPKYEYKVDMIKIEDILKNNLSIDISKYDLIGIGSQVIGYGSPSIVHKFIRSFPEVKDKKIFIFRTAGGVAPINYNVSKSIIRVLRKKGYDVFYERVFSIGSNWVVKFSDNVVKKLYEATRKKVSIMCVEIISGEKRILKTSLWLIILMEFVALISRPFFNLLGKDIAANKACEHCGLCIKNCPAQNIYENNGKIKFKLSCNCCMRCIYSCPKNALNFRLAKFFAVPGGYNIKKTLEKEYDLSGGNNKDIPAFFHNYITDDKL